MKWIWRMLTLIVLVTFSLCFILIGTSMYPNLQFELKGQSIDFESHVRYVENAVITASNISNDSISVSNFTELGPSKVVLFTLYRGGSTFLGEIFGQNPEAFYWFEPLNQFMDYYKAVEKATGYNVIERFYMKTEDGLLPLPPEALYNRTDVILETLSCSPRKRVIQPGSSAASANHMPAAKSYADCIQKPKNTHELCLPLLKDICLQARIVAVKTMRLPIYLAEELFDADPATKIIYYVRDPRGIINSRKVTDKLRNVQLMIRVAEDICQKLVKNDQYVLKLLQNYPQNVLTVRYEDLSQNPEDQTRRIYEFLQQPVPDQVRNWLRTNTNATGSKNAYDTKRNSSITMSKWKKQLPAAALKGINEKCAEALKLLGYD